MCAREESGTTFAAGLAEARTGRRTLLAVGGGLLFSTAFGVPARAASTTQRAYVIVLDGTRPDEIDGGLMPTVRALRDGGQRWPNAVSMPVTETIPNHVMMMTGVRPDRSGVPANAIYDRSLGVVRDMDRATDIQVDTVIERLNRKGLTTGTVLSKEYLYGIFGERASHRWEPQPVIPVSGHAPDVFTMQAALSMLTEFDPHLMFVNLGDIDRFGHSDVTGPLGIQATRRLALADTDQQVKRFVEALKSSGRWESSIMIVLADHSMDWSLPDHVISLTAPLAADPLLAGNVQIAQNGGADLLYWTGPAELRQEAIGRMTAIAGAVDGVLSAQEVAASPALRLGPEAGDVLVYAKASWRFSDPDVASNPIPGNHGHPATQPIPFFIAGGHPVVRRGETSSLQARTIDVAPTLAAYFGVGGPAGGYDGAPRLPRVR